jgi:predicted component of viral defense system (DUF524 family)
MLIIIIMETSTTPYRSLNIFYPKDSKDYKQIEELVKRSDITKLLQDNFINVFTLMREDITKLIVHLNDFNMMPIIVFNELTEKTINEIIQLCTKLGQPKQTAQTAQTVQGGARTSYKYKYEKYKTKYNMMNGVITKMNY